MNTATRTRRLQTAVSMIVDRAAQGVSPAWARAALKCCAAALVLLTPSLADAADRYAVVITGASGGPSYAEKYNRWRASLVATLKQRFRYPDDHLFALAELEGQGAAKATRDNVRRIFGDLKSRVHSDDLVFVVLIGHGTTADDGEAKFNLVGPDLSSIEWAEILKPIPSRVAFVDATGGSFPFMRRLAAPNRVILTATDSAAQQFETVFPEFFVKAFEDPAADADKNGRVSMWEAFVYASNGVRMWFDRQGQLATERPLLDDNGDGVGREAQNPGLDGALARAVFLAPEAPESANASDAPLLSRRAELERQLDDLRLRKASSADPERYDADIEKILLEIAQISSRLRQP